MNDELSAEARQAAKRDEIEMLLIREGLSLAVMLLALLLLSPKARMWVAAQRHRLQRHHAEATAHEATALAELRRELSRDLPLVEHGLVDP